MGHMSLAIVSQGRVSGEVRETVESDKIGLAKPS